MTNVLLFLQLPTTEAEVKPQVFQEAFPNYPPSCFPRVTSLTGEHRNNMITCLCLPPDWGLTNHVLRAKLAHHLFL